MASKSLPSGKYRLKKMFYNCLTVSLHCRERANQLFDALDADGSGSITLYEFVDGIYELSPIQFPVVSIFG
jgi:membrane-bound lytic murein transglycosylase MltF